MEKVGSAVVHSEYSQQCYPYNVSGKTLIITTTGLKMEMSSVPHKAQECQFSGHEGSLNFLKCFTLLAFKNSRLCTKF